MDFWTDICTNFVDGLDWHNSFKFKVLSYTFYVVDL